MKYFATQRSEYFEMPMSISLFSWSQLRLLILLGLSFGDVVRGQYGAIGMGNEEIGLSPRYYLGLGEGRLLERDGGGCDSGYHSCNYSHFCISALQSFLEFMPSCRVL